MKVLLDTVSAVQEFVALACQCKSTVDVVSGKYTVDAKSIMGVFSLNLSTPVEIVVDASETEFLEAIKKWSV